VWQSIAMAHIETEHLVLFQNLVFLTEEQRIAEIAHSTAGCVGTQIEQNVLL
jgi:hypothetical protein